MKANIVNMIFGSHLYGLNTPTSDVDYAGVYLPTLDELLLGSYKDVITTSTGNNNSKNSVGDIDVDLYALPFFLKQACKGETKMLDMLRANTVELGEYGSIWTELVKNRNQFNTKNLKAYMGYVKRQAAKYGLKGSRISAMREAIAELEKHESLTVLSDIWDKLPENEFANKIELTGSNGVTQKFYEVNGKKYQSSTTVDYTLTRIIKALDGYGARALLAEKNEGVDWKAVSHAIRAGYQLLGIFKDGDFTYPLPQTQYLLDVKQGKLDYKSEVADVLEGIVDEIESLVPTVNLPEKVDRNYWDKWLLNVYKEFLINENI